MHGTDPDLGIEECRHHSPFAPSVSGFQVSHFGTLDFFKPSRYRELDSRVYFEFTSPHLLIGISSSSLSLSLSLSLS